MRILNYIAPTWSWASFQGPISYWIGNLLLFAEHYKVICTHKIVGDKYSDVASAQLTIRLPTRGVRIASRGRLDTSNCGQAEKDELDDGVQCDLNEENAHTDCEILLALVSNEGGLILKPQAGRRLADLLHKNRVVLIVWVQEYWTKWEKMDIIII